MFTIRYRLAALAIVVVSATAGLNACGGGNDTGKKLQQQGAALQQEGTSLQKFAAQEQADVQAGRKTAEQAATEIQAKTDAIQKHAAQAADTAIDAAKAQNGLPADAQKQLEQAQAQLDAATN